jgi:DNA repair exonuclease SbcCD ATPase subunit
MTDKLTPGEALQKILDALGVDDLNLNSRGLLEDYIRQAARAESAKEIERLNALLEIREVSHDMQNNLGKENERLREEIERHLSEKQELYSSVAHHAKQALQIEVENRRLREEIAEKDAEIERLKRVVDATQECTERLERWLQSYPIGTFTPPTAEQWLNAHDYFKAQGFTLDRISGEYGRLFIESIKPTVDDLVRTLATTKKEG